jgi:3-dehydroquinate dehydratase-2
VSVIRDLCVATVKGEGVEGYRTALTRIKQELGL